METTVKIELNGQIKEYPHGISLLDLSKEYQKDYNADIILASVGNSLRELSQTVEQDCKVTFLTTKDDAGHKTYVRGITLVMLKALYNVVGADKIIRASVEYSLGNGLYCPIEMTIPMTEELCNKIKERMGAIIQEDYQILKKSIGTNEAIELFNRYKMYDKERLFQYRRVSKTNVYNLEGFEDYIMDICHQVQECLNTLIYSLMMRVLFCFFQRRIIRK